MSRYEPDFSLKKTVADELSFVATSQGHVALFRRQCRFPFPVIKVPFEASFKASFVVTFDASFEASFEASIEVTFEALFEMSSLLQIGNTLSFVPFTLVEQFSSSMD
jgi:hypothetical protein